MPEFCTLRLQGADFDTAPCSQICEGLWDAATENDIPIWESYDGPTMEIESPDDAASRCQHQYLEYGRATLRAIGEHDRYYVIVDQCMRCGSEVGDQGYAFKCPLPLEAPFDVST